MSLRGKLEERGMQMNGWIGVDLDGCLAQYDHWKGVTHIGPPVSAMVERVKLWLVQGFEVRVFTARVSGRDGNELQLAHDTIAQWTEEHIGVRLKATCIKDYACKVIYDDRCRQVEPNTGRIIGEVEPA
jgi:hypothetical protein